MRTPLRQGIADLMPDNLKIAAHIFQPLYKGKTELCIELDLLMHTQELLRQQAVAADVHLVIIVGEASISEWH